MAAITICSDFRMRLILVTTMCENTSKVLPFREADISFGIQNFYVESVRRHRNYSHLDTQFSYPDSRPQEQKIGVHHKSYC